MKDEPRDEEHHDQQRKTQAPLKMYLRFAAMILTAMVVIYWVMFVGSWEWGHIRFSQSRVYMTITMGGTMGLVMLAWMLNMGAFLDRSQTTMDDTAFMRGTIPNHSLAITRSERAQLEDLRVCELAVQISEVQRRESLEMDWLVKDAERNGVARTPEEARSRAVPDYEREADRS